MSLNIEQPDALPRKRSFERRQAAAEPTQSYDLVCVGFGTTALPLAAALADKNGPTRVLFVERKSHFHWQPAHVLPEKPIGTSFLRDLATTQNPKSAYTFVNFLHATNQLVRFTNNSKLAPSRRLMGQYFQWAADKIASKGWISYGQEAVRVRPVRGVGSQSNIGEWAIDLQNTKTMVQTTVLAKTVVLATGAQPHIPQAVAGAPLVLHSSQSEDLLESIGSARPLNIAVIGSDQEAAEIFEHLHTARQGKHTASLFFPDSALRPEDDVPSMQDLPSHLPPEVRQRSHRSAVQSPKIDLKTLESLFEAQYTQKIHEPKSSKWRFQLKPFSEVVGVERDGDQVRLLTTDPRNGEVKTTAQAFDVIIAATGYSFSINTDLIQIPPKLLETSSISVDREYRVNLRRDALAAGCGIWLLGSLEDRKVRNDDFSWMAERSQRVAKSILESVEAEQRQGPGLAYGERAMI